MKYFNNILSLDDLKKEYRRLTKFMHPDCGGDHASYIEMRGEFEKAFEILKNRQNAESDDQHRTTETPEEFAAIIEKLIHLSGIEIEICGSWLWISGNTYPVKDELKSAGCKFASKKKCWYWHPENEVSTSRRSTPMAVIREKYGSTIIQQRPQARLAQ